MKPERDYLLSHHYGSSATGRRPQGRLGIREDDYRAAPIPVNLPVPIAGSCLLWRWGLNLDGYGVLNVDGHTKLAHRVAYEQANKFLHNDAQVLHLCHRPYCVQPAHLYLGTRAQNVEDREARVGKMDPDILSPMPSGGIPALAEKVGESGGALLKYVGNRWEESSYSADTTWPDPKEAPKQLKLGPHSATECPGHRFRIPAGDAKLCTICGASNSGMWEDVPQWRSERNS